MTNNQRWLFHYQWSEASTVKTIKLVQCLFLRVYGRNRPKFASIGANNGLKSEAGYER